MAISISEAQRRLISSGALDKIGSNPDKPDFDSVVEEIVALWGQQDFIPAVKKSIQKKKVVATKALLQSIGMDVVSRGNNIVRFKLLADEHWIFAEKGRKAGKRPPVKAIEQWITAKGIPVRQNKSESKLTVLQRRRQMATSIAMAIGRRGTIKRFKYKGSDFLGSVTPDSMKTLSDLLTRALGYSVIVAIVKKDQK